MEILKIAVTCLFCFSVGLLSCKAQDSMMWNSKKELKHLENREDSSTWDNELLIRDLNRNKETTSEPMTFGAFPVPKYKLLGQNSFKGVGTGGNLSVGIKLNDKQLLYSYFLVNKNSITEKYIGDNENEVFFTIVVLTDFVDTTNYTHAGVHIISRNNPDYIGQGFFKTKNDQVDYIAFLTANRDKYAIVNMRLFNLNFGSTILIAPQKNGSLRSKQINGPILSGNEVDEYINRLLEKETIKEFFLSPENI